MPSLTFLLCHVLMMLFYEKACKSAQQFHVTKAFVAHIIMWHNFISFYWSIIKFVQQKTFIFLPFFLEKLLSHFLLFFIADHSYMLIIILLFITIDIIITNWNNITYCFIWLTKNSFWIYKFWLHKYFSVVSPHLYHQLGIKILNFYMQTKALRSQLRFA